MSVFLLFLLFKIILCEDNVIYYLNEADYARMPPIAELDPYEECHSEPGGIYCTVQPDLVSDVPSHVLDMIKAYSEHQTTHYNHSKLIRGVCLTRTCKDYITINSDSRTTDSHSSDLRTTDSLGSDSQSPDLRTTLERCLNATLYSQYKLRVLVDDYHCSSTKPGNKQTEYDDFSVIVGKFFIAILLLNLIGTLYHFWTKHEKSKETSILLCFSLQRNWHQFGLRYHNDDESLPNLKALHGIRVLTVILVIVSHSVLPFVYLAEDTRIIGMTMKYRILHGILAGPYIMQTFIIMSTFLLVYKMLIVSENTEIKWSSVPKILFLRWLRLSVPYGIMIALTVTWFGRFTSGPMYHHMVGAEIEDCKINWWSHVLMINNFVVDKECFRQGWYISTDFQLHIIAVLVFMLCRFPCVRRVLLPALFVSSILILAAHTYFQDLDINVISCPRTVLTFFKTDRTYNEAYIKPQTNMSACLLGIWLADVTHRWEKQRFDVSKYQNRFTLFLYSCLFPLAFLCCYIAGLVYEDIPRPSLIIRTVAAAIIKPLFAFFITLIMLGTFYNFDTLYRGILEWRGFRLLSSLTFGAYLLHVCFIRNYVATITTLVPLTSLSIVKVQALILTLSFASSFIFWMLLEAPLGNIIRLFFQSNKVVKRD